MASTYSDLKIQLMTTGENDTTWGTVTNTNLGTAIEEAISGTADVTFASANVTLTWINSNASQTARNMRLNLVGTTGGSPRDLVVPAIEKMYVVNNTCGDAVTVKVSGQTGVTVPAGYSMLLFNDGTDVRRALVGTSVDEGGTGRTSLNANSVVLGNGTSAVQFVAPGNSGNILASNGTTWVSQALDLTPYAVKTTTVTGTGGLTGGGDLSANRTISIASTSNGYGTRTVSTGSPSGGSDGDIWYKV